MHHVFDGGWMWVLRFGTGVTRARSEKANWYGVDNADLVAGAPKLGVSADAVRTMLRNLGL